MNYSTIIPKSSLQHLVECFWFVDGDDTEEQKIIPDGFPEIIFHFGDPYELRESGGIASRQEKILLSGQIMRPILLRPTGRSNVFGIKFKPAGIWNLFRVNMSELKNRVVPLNLVTTLPSHFYETLLSASVEQRVHIAEEFMLEISTSTYDDISTILKTIEKTKGDLSIEALCEKHNITARKLQRLFQHQVGVTAKQYARIVRFRTVYALLQKPMLTKADSLYLTGYFDQPHFNREFREFTNESPEMWFSKNHEFSNLFMNR